MKENVIVKMKFGSHLYGTNTPESDKDYKGIFMPTKEQLLLGRMPKPDSKSTGNNLSKNTAKDVDMEWFTFQRFVVLACEGQTVALDMLHAPDDMIIESSPLWDHLVSKRKMFYTKNLNAFVEYARKQAAKYGIKGSRLSDAKIVKGILEMAPYRDAKVKTLWEGLPDLEHVYHVDPDPNGFRQYQVCGKKFQETVKVQYALDIVERFISSFGNRAVLAAENKGIDWKAVSHAIRAALQVRELLVHETITFPLKDADLVKRVKCEEVDYLTEAAPLLEDLIDQVTELSGKSKLPEKTDVEYWESFVCDQVMNYHGINYEK